jgi:hypothetical protein
LQNNLYKLWKPAVVRELFSSAGAAGRDSKGNGGTRPLASDGRRHDWVLDIDVKGYFDSIEGELLLMAVRHHTSCLWVLLYIERRLKSPVQMEDGQRRAAHSGNAAAWGHQPAPCKPVFALCV